MCQDAAGKGTETSVVVGGPSMYARPRHLELHLSWRAGQEETGTPQTWMSSGLGLWDQPLSLGFLWPARAPRYVKAVGLILGVPT